MLKKPCDLGTRSISKAQIGTTPISRVRGNRGGITLDTSARRMTFLMTSLVCFSVQGLDAGKEDMFQVGPGETDIDIIIVEKERRL